MDIAEVLQFVDEVLCAKTGKRLNDLQRRIIEGTLKQQKYSEIADTYGLTPGHVKDIGYELLQMLSDVFGEPVGEREMLNLFWNRQGNLNINFGYCNSTNFWNSHIISYINGCSDRPTATPDTSRPETPDFQDSTDEVKIENGW